MKKGCTKPCPSCKKIFLRYAQFKGEGVFEARCPHCGILAEVKVEMNQCIHIEHKPIVKGIRPIDQKSSQAV